MTDTATRNIRVSTDSSVHLKKCWSVGNVIVVAIAEEIVKRLGINEDSTYVQQEITVDGILLRVKHYVKEGKI
ncbi:MAG: hypothetical protein WBZ36_03465 [Candidatus Nitrosopolaris sp.]